jgi:hypothetical protein
MNIRDSFRNSKNLQKSAIIEFTSEILETEKNTQKFPYTILINFKDGVNDDYATFKKKLIENLFIHECIYHQQENHAGSEEIYECYSDE